MERCYCFKDGNLTAEQIVDRIDAAITDIAEYSLWINKGSGWCASFVQHFTHAPKTGEWRQGSKVYGNLLLLPGTAIATFDSSGRYPGLKTGNHAAIYLGQNPWGIDVYHQVTTLGEVTRPRGISDTARVSTPRNMARYTHDTSFKVSSLPSEKIKVASPVPRRGTLPIGGGKILNAQCYSVVTDMYSVENTFSRVMNEDSARPKPHFLHMMQNYYK